MTFIAPLLIALTLALPSYGHSEGPFSSEKNLGESKALTVQPATLEELRQADPLEIAQLDRYDSRLYDIVTPIKKQQLNICWSYATMAASETSILREGLFESPDRSLDLSELSHAYRTFNNELAWDPLGLTVGDDCHGDHDRGYHLAGSGMKMLNWATPAFEPYYEPRPEVKPADFLLEDIVHVNHNDIDDIKRAISRYGAVTVAYTLTDWHEEYYHYNGNYFGFPHGFPGSNHAVTIVGWDDTVSRDAYTKMPASLDGGWIVKNSWGTSHAEGDGYFMMSYDTPIWDIFAFDFAPKEDYDFNYHYDGVVDREDHVPEGQPAAAIFPAKKSSLGKQEFLQSVNVTVKDLSSPKSLAPGKIVAKVYADVPADSSDIYSPINNPSPTGKLVATAERNIDHEGSYTLKLPTPIALEKDRFFSVVAEVESAKGNYQIALSNEPSSSDNDMTYTRSPNGEWVNCGSPSIRRVARIKAFTKLMERPSVAEKDLRFAEMGIDQALRPRYGTVPSRMEAVLTCDGAELIEGVDYALEPIDVQVKPNLVETTSDYDVVATGTLVAKGKGEWKGEARVSFPILVGMHDLSALGEVSSDKTVRLSADGSHQKYGDILLPEKWEFLFKDDSLQLGANEGNYLQYVGEDELCYRRNMFPVIVEKSADIPPKTDLSSAEMSLAQTEFVYSGNAHLPSVEVRFHGAKLQINRDYRVQYRDNVNAGSARAEVFGVGEYQGKKELPFHISPAEISAASISSVDPATYTGEEIHPQVTLSFAGMTLQEGKDYRLSYENAVNAGTAKIVFTGLGNFQGRAERSFEIQKAGNAIEHFEIQDGKLNAESQFGEIVFKYYADPACANEIAKPSAPGTYYVKAYVEGNDNYEGAESAPIEFRIDAETPGPSEPLPPQEEPTGEGNNGWVIALSVSLVCGFAGVGALLYFVIVKKRRSKK